MIKIQIISADNLPVPTKKERKTKIYCFSSSSCNYLYDSFKNNENSNNPKWNCTIDVDLFRCCTLSFKIYSSRLLSNEIFLGDVNIDFSKFLYQPPGNEILKIPYSCVRYEFPITSCTSANATLSLSFLFVPKTYRPIKFKDVSSPFLHVWATFTPTLQGINDNIEIELLQAYTFNKKNEKNGFFFNLNNSISWESVGYSSITRTFLGPTGYTPIRSLFLDRINGLLNFFIVNVHDYSGVVTLNFVAEREGKDEYFDDNFFISPRKDKDHLIGTVKTVDIQVEPNMKYVAPVYLFYEKKMLKSTFEINQFQSFSEKPDYSKSEYNDQICCEIPFQRSIIEAAKNQIESLRGVNFTKVFMMPLNEKISLKRIFSEFNLQPRMKIRIYINGFTRYSNGKINVVHFWKPFFHIFDTKTGRLCTEISESLLKKPSYQFRTVLGKNNMPFDWHICVDLDLEKIGIDKIVVLNIKCMSPLESANPPGTIHIVAVDEDKETVLLRNPVFEDNKKNNCGVFMRLEFAEDSWNIVPMRFCFDHKKKLDAAVAGLYSNNWEMSQSLNEKISSISEPSSSDSDILLDDVEYADVAK